MKAARSAKKNNRRAGTSRSPFEIRIPLEVHKEYIDYHNHIDIASHIAWALAERDRILKKKTPLEEKKKIIFLLGHIPKLKALYGIQKYLKNPDKELERFAALAWQECQSLVLGVGMKKLFKDVAEMPLVMGGLGGDGQRLRYQFVLSAIGSKDIIRANIKWIQRVIEKEHKTKGAQIEEAVFRPNVIICTSLVSNDVAVGNHIEHVIAKINAEKGILRHHYFVTNTHEIQDEEIAKYLEGLNEEELPQQ